MTILGTLTLTADSRYNGRRIGDMTPAERETVRQHFVRKGAKEVVFKGCEPYYTKEVAVL